MEYMCNDLIWLYSYVQWLDDYIHTYNVRRFPSIHETVSINCFASIDQMAFKLGLHLGNTCPNAKCIGDLILFGHSGRHVAKQVTNIQADTRKESTYKVVGGHVSSRARSPWGLLVSSSSRWKGATHKYQIFPLKALCKRYLTNHVHTNNVMSMIKLASKTEPGHLNEATLNVAGTMYKDLMACPYLKKPLEREPRIVADMLKEILVKRECKQLNNRILFMYQPLCSVLPSSCFVALYTSKLWSMHFQFYCVLNSKHPIHIKGLKHSD